MRASRFPAVKSKDYVSRFLVDRSKDCFSRCKFILEYEEEISEMECYKRLEKLQLTVGGQIIFQINGNYLYKFKVDKNVDDKKRKWDVWINLGQYGFDYMPLCGLCFHEVCFFIYTDARVEMEVLYDDMGMEEKEMIKDGCFDQNVKLPRVEILKDLRGIYVPEVVENSLYFYVESENMATFCKDGNELLSTYYGDGLYNVEVEGDCLIEIMGVNDCRVEIYYLRKNEFRVFSGMGGLKYST